MQKYRKTSQILFLLLVFFIPIINSLELYFIKGTYISLDVGNLAISDPLAVFQAIFLSHELNAVMLVSIALPILITLIFGRVWCSFACPYLLIVEFIERMRKKLKLKKLHNNVPVGVANIMRFAFLILGFIFVGMLGVPILYLFSPPSLISTQMILLIKQFTLTFEILFLIALLIVDTFFISHFWCKLACPTGSVLALFNNKLRMRVSYSGSCSDCGKCKKVCPFGVDPRDDSTNIQCTNCGKCISVCNDNAKTDTLYFKI